MNILLTGATGFLGKQVYLTCAKHNSVDTLSRSMGTYVVDLTITKPVFDKYYDIVIHCSGKAHVVPKTIYERQDFFHVNVNGTKNLLDALLAGNVLPKSFVFISSVAVYGRLNGLNIDENCTLSATDPYGLSKIEAEKMVLDWCSAYNVTCTILRLPLLAGPNPPGNLQSLIQGIKKGYYFNIDNGGAKKSIVLVSDISDIILGAAANGGVYNLTDGENPTFGELSALVARQLGKNRPRSISFKIAFFIATIGDLLGSNSPFNTDKLKKMTSHLTFDDNKARRNLGWKPNRVLDNFRIK